MKLFILFFIFSSTALASSTTAPSDNLVYKMDLFSIISFGLAIAAFALSVFMGWLSWKFYEKSSDDSRKTQGSVVKIETAVLGVQSNITEIVKQAVAQWTAGSNIQPFDYRDKMEELFKLARGESNSSEIQEALKNLEQTILEHNTSYLAELRAKAIFPSIDTGLISQSGPVSRFSQNVQVNTEEENSGELNIEVLRESKIATISGKFEPAFKSIPKEFSAELISAPVENKDDISVTYGVGKVFDFNIHLKHKLGYLPIGNYVVKYKAKQ